MLRYDHFEVKKNPEINRKKCLCIDRYIGLVHVPGEGTGLPRWAGEGVKPCEMRMGFSGSQRFEPFSY